MVDYGDFTEVQELQVKNKNVEVEPEKQGPCRVRLPQQKQLIGIVIERLGGKRMSVKATDKKIRNCVVPGRFKRKFWLRPGQAVIIVPWEFDNNKADIVHQYRPNETFQLKKRGFLKDLEEGF